MNVNKIKIKLTFRERCKQIMNNQECDHHFEFSTAQTEATADNPVYHPVGYSVCRKCGEVRKNDL